MIRSADAAAPNPPLPPTDDAAAAGAVTTTSARRARAPWLAYLTSPVLVAGATWVLLWVQSQLASPNDERVRPFSIGFVLVIALMTIWGGIGPGLVTLALALFSTVYVLIEPRFSFLVDQPRDEVELLALLVVGTLLLLAVQGARRAGENARQALAESEAARRAAEEARARLQTFLDTAPLGVLTSDARGAISYANREAERIWGQPFSPAGPDGSHAAFRLRDAQNQPISPEQSGLARVLRGEARVIEADKIVERPDGVHVPVHVQSTSVRDDADRLLGGLVLLTDLSEQRHAEEARRQFEAQHQSLFDTVPLGVTYQDQNSRILAANPAAQRLLGLTLDQMQGRSSLDPRWRAIHEDGSDFPGETHPSVVALQTGQVVQNVVMGVFNPQHENYRWLNVTAVPQFRPGDDAPFQVYTVFEDVTERRRADEERAERARLRALRADVSKTLVQSDAPLPETLRLCMEAVVTHLDAAFARVWLLNEAENVLEMQASAGLYTHTNGAHGRVPVGQWKIGLIAQERRPHLTNQVIGDPRVSDQEWAKRENMVAFAGYPLVVRDQLLGVIALFARRPLSQATQDALAPIANDLALGIERKRAETERERLLKSERLANEIAQAQRASLDPDAVQRVAVEKLGQALGVDRCYLIQYDLAHDRASMRGDWYGPNLAPLAGDYRVSDFRVNPEDAYRDGKTVVASDVRSHPATAAAAAGYEALGVRAAIFVPLYDENRRLVGALSVNMANTPRDWTPAEVSLVEAVAAQTHSTMNTARLMQRDRTIAERLQNTLRPQLPERVPGLDLREHYQAALAEATVGGDFFDVFNVEKGCVALVVGDLSGKGLDAASQVALVRNMLRFALYNGRTVADALADLNRTLSEHDLLVGFATLFVGVYDTGERTLTYVSCGHEPALLRRAATGRVEELPATGPVLGAFAEATYRETVVPLAENDALAIYTDGFSEAGRNQHDFLGVAGLARLLEECSPSAAAIKEHLVEGVRAHARGDLHDDTCLLVAVVKPGLSAGT